jgi:hypothetical protein
LYTRDYSGADHPTYVGLGKFQHGPKCDICSRDNFPIIGSRGERSGNRGDRDRFRRRKRERERMRTRRGDEEGEGGEATKKGRGGRVEGAIMEEQERGLPENRKRTQIKSREYHRPLGRRAAASAECGKAAQNRGKSLPFRCRFTDTQILIVM